MKFEIIFHNNKKKKKSFSYKFFIFFFLLLFCLFKYIKFFSFSNENIENPISPFPQKWTLLDNMIAFNYYWFYFLFWCLIEFTIHETSYRWKMVLLNNSIIELFGCGNGQARWVLYWNWFHKNNFQESEKRKKCKVH